MLKKIIVVAGFTALFGILIVGTVSRTIERLNRSGEGSEPHETAEQANGAAEAITAPGWRTVEGIAAEVSTETLSLNMGAGIVLIEGQPWSYALRTGFSARAGDRLTLEGYDEDGEFKAGRLTNQTSGLSIQLRGADGSPAWRGQGKGQGGG